MVHSWPAINLALTWRNLVATWAKLRQTWRARGRMAEQASDSAPPELDVITIGRSSVDLYGQQIGSRLEDVASFAKSVGGCPANIAVGAARLGLKSAIITGVG